MKTIILLVVILSMIKNIQAQLIDGSIAPNWTLKDINGNMHTLYDYLNQGKYVILDFSSTWCGPCWDYHQSGILKDVYNLYGPNGTLDTTMMVFLIESDGATISQLYNSTTGNWVQGTPYPIIATCDISLGGNGMNVVNAYNINYFPTIYTICPYTKKIYESGQLSSASLHYYFAQNECYIQQSPYDIAVINLLGSYFMNYQYNSCQMYCNENQSINFKVVIQNLGAENINSCKLLFGKLYNNYNISYFNVLQEDYWYGSLAPYAIDTIDFTVNTILQSGYQYIIKVVEPNNNVESDTLNNDFIINLNIQLQPEPLPLYQTFTNYFLPDNYSYYNPNNDSEIWFHLNNYIGYDDSSSMLLCLSSIPSGYIDDFILPLLTFQNAINPKLSFYVAYGARNQNNVDTLRVEVSTDCGDTWTTAWQKFGQQLQTTSPISYLFIPSSNQWRYEQVDLSNYQGYDNVLIRFRCISDNGNRLYIDKINVQNTPTGNQEQTLKNEVQLYPNIVQSHFYINNAENSLIEMYDVTGNIVYSKEIKNSLEEITVLHLSDGVYLVKIKNNGLTNIKKLIISR